MEKLDKTNNQNQTIPDSHYTEDDLNTLNYLAQHVKGLSAVSSTPRYMLEQDSDI